MRRGLETVHPDCYPFVAAVEELLKRRRDEARTLQYNRPAWWDDAWGPRAWTRTELEDIVYSSYKRMRQGHITRPPRRTVIMEIADYLNCTLEERNRLLMAAHYPPISPYFTGERLSELVAVTAEVARQLVVPAMIINRDWHIHYLNPQLLTLQEITPTELAAIPPHHINFLRLMFDPALPLYPKLIRNRASWTRMARQTLYGFKMANILCQFEGWYQALVEDFMSLPEFATHWQSVPVDVPFNEDYSAQNLPSSVTVETIFGQVGGEEYPLWLRPLVISAGYFQFDFPQILAFLPADEASHAMFVQAGLVISPPLR